jgi:hypothetical protein
MTPGATRLIRRHLDRKTPWRLVKKYCRAAGGIRVGEVILEIAKILRRTLQRHQSRLAW